MKIFLHDTECQPLGIVTLDWDVEERGPWVKIPVYGRVASRSYSGREIAYMAQPFDDNHVMEIHLSPFRYRHPNGRVAEEWIGCTATPELCERFFETKF